MISPNVEETVPRCPDLTLSICMAFVCRRCHERFGHMRARETAMVKTLALAHDAIIYAK